MEIKWSPDSLLRLQGIGDFIAKDNPKRSGIFVEKIIESVGRLEKFPASGALVPEHPAFRQVVTQGYRVIYRFNSNKIEIVTVVGPGQVFQAKNF